MKYESGYTIKTSKEFPEGVPCVIHDGDSVLCECRGSNGIMDAAMIADALNYFFNHNGA